MRHQEASELVDAFLVGEFWQGLRVLLDLPSEIAEVHCFRRDSDVVILLIGEEREGAHVAVAGVATRLAVEERPPALRGFGDGPLVACQEPIDRGLHIEQRPLEARDRLYHPLDGHPPVAKGFHKEGTILREALQLGLDRGVVGHRHLDWIYQWLQRLVFERRRTSVPKLVP